MLLLPNSMEISCLEERVKDLWLASNIYLRVKTLKENCCQHILVGAKRICYLVILK